VRDELQVGIGLCQGDTGSQAADDAVVEIVSFIRQLLGSESDGDEEVGCIALIHAGKWKDKGRGQYTDYRVDLAIERDGATHNAGRAGKLALPESVAEDGYGVSGLIFFGSENAAKDWLCAKK
jgi:hypothetical protein